MIETTGEKDIYLIFEGGSGFLFDVDWFVFSSLPTTLNVATIEEDLNQPFIYPNPVSSSTTIENASNSQITIYDMGGKEVFFKNLLNDKEVLDLSSLSTGIYYGNTNAKGKRSIFKIVKD